MAVFFDLFAFDSCAYNYEKKQGGTDKTASDSQYSDDITTNYRRAHINLYF